MEKVPPAVKKEELKKLSKEEQEKADLEKSQGIDFDGSGQFNPATLKEAIKKAGEEGDNYEPYIK